MKYSGRQNCRVSFQMGRGLDVLLRTKKAFKCLSMKLEILSRVVARDGAPIDFTVKFESEILLNFI